MLRYVMCVVFTFALVGCEWFAKDQCLDAGGSYNEAEKKCEK